MAGGLAAIFAMAEDDHIDMSAFMRLAAWGLCTVLSLFAVVLAGQSDIGHKRVSTAFDSLKPAQSRPSAAQLLAHANNPNQEARRLTEAVRLLASDRDRLAMRLAAIERNLDGITESIARSDPTATANLPAIPASPKTDAKPSQASSMPPKQQVSAAPQSPPASTPTALATTVSRALQTPASHQSVTMTISSVPERSDSLRPSPSAATAEPATTASTTARATTLSQSVSATSSINAPDQPDSLRLSPLAAAESPVISAPAVTGATPPSPQALAVLPPKKPSSMDIMTAMPAPPVVSAPIIPITAAGEAVPSDAIKTEFAIDLGSSPTIQGLRRQWTSLKTKHAPLIEGLRPLIAVREHTKKPAAPQLRLRLIVGPLIDAAAAAQLCAAFASFGHSCTPAVFDGQRLALR